MLILIQRLLEKDFDLIDSIVHARPLFTEELAEALAEFYRKHGLLDPFLEWVVRMEGLFWQMISAKYRK